MLFILHCYPVQIWVFDSESAHKKSELYRRSLGARADLDQASGLSDWLWNKKPPPLAEDISVGPSHAAVTMEFFFFYFFRG